MNSLRTSLEAVWYTAVAIALQQKHLLLNTYELLSDIWFVLINDNIASNVRFEVMRHGTFFNLATSRYSYS
ncbi:MAG: hypothetical protein RM338_23575 [Nostoc sp. DedQUE12a]|nr:hypothetical protein [Nostoc sp. DedQUE12a]